MPGDASIHPTIAASFRCIGSQCEDTCCQGWHVPVDRASWDRFQDLALAPLPELIRENIQIRGAEGGGKPRSAATSADSFAFIRMNGEKRCPLLTEERLCRVQAELGEGLLPHICAVYPRIFHTHDGVRETVLALSCPEAARLILLTPTLMGGLAEPQPAECSSLPADYWPIRSLVLRLVRARAYPMWQRMFLLGLLCQRLDSIFRGESDRSAPEFLRDFEGSVVAGSLRPMMEGMATDRDAQLDVVLRLAGLMLHKSNVHPRFVECIEAFTRGIGNRAGATLSTLGAGYAQAHERVFVPFFERHPYILENLLINIVLRYQFPFGKEGMAPGAQASMAREFTRLTAQMALLRGLLIGVAGCHGTAFSTAHVVHTVQAAAKHYEHHPEFLPMAQALLVESGMDGARGWAILFRNGETDRVPANAQVGEPRPADAVTPGVATPSRRRAWATVPAGKGHRE